MNATKTTILADRNRKAWLWIAGGFAIVLFIALGLRFGTDVIAIGEGAGGSPYRFDEKWITMPIFDLIERGWSVETAIDFQETKGPGMIWPYAIAGEVLGAGLNSLRAFSVAMFVLSAIPLLWIARRSGWQGPMLPVTGTLYVLLPYNAILGQLVMSEALFDFTALLLMAIFLWGFGSDQKNERRIVGPVLYGIVLSIMLHNRLHAVAFAGAACLTAFERDRLRSWPWWTASIVAGLSRLPLWARWGGPVGSRFESQHDVGIGLESLTYLAAAMAPMLAVFLIIVLLRRQCRAKLWMAVVGGIVGVALGILATPDLAQKFPFEGGEIARYHGPAASLVRAVSASPITQGWMIAAMAACGLAGLGAVGAVAWRGGLLGRESEIAKAQAAAGEFDEDNSTYDVVARLVFWTLLCGWGMYALTAASVFDRYLLPWAILLPIVYARALPRWVMALQGLLLAAIAGQHVWQWLVIH